MSDELREWIAEVIEESAIQWRTDFIRYMNSDTPDPGPCSWNQAQAIIDDLGLIVVDVPGGISDYSPFTGKPVVQPDRWYVEGERVLEREPRP